MSGATVRRYAENYQPSRLTSSARQAMQEYLRSLGVNWQETTGNREWARAALQRAEELGSELMWPDPEPDDPDDVRQLLAFFSAGPEGFRRMARHIPLSDLAKAALKTAIDDGMPDDHFQRLYARLKHLLPRNDG